MPVRHFDKNKNISHSGKLYIERTQAKTVPNAAETKNLLKISAAISNSRQVSAIFGLKFPLNI